MDETSRKSTFAKLRTAVRLSRRAPLLGAIVLAALFIGCGAGALWLAPSTPNTLAPAESPEWVPVTSRTFDDRRTVQLSFTQSAATSLHAPTSGTVTAFSCSPGSALTSGTSALSIDGARIVSLATTVPLWRDLFWGDQGEDVSALQQELTRLGYSVADEEGTVGPATFTAVAALFAEAGDAAVGTASISASRFLWLPSPSATPRECFAPTGAIVTVGDELASFPGRVSSARFDITEGELVYGERVGELAGETFPVGEDGIVSDDEALMTIGASPLLLEAVANAETSVPASLMLKNPTEVQVVPPSSLVALNGSTGCVVTPEETRDVTVVGSELGQSFITFNEGGVPDSVAFSPIQATACE